MQKIRFLTVGILIGLLVSVFWQQVTADAEDNRILEVTQSGSGVRVYDGPGTHYAELERLLWGDRVLWLGNTQEVDGGLWYEVVLGSGNIGWMPFRSGGTIETTTLYTTPDVRVGSTITVLPDGGGAHLRVSPSAYVDEVREINTGETLTVIGGPYQAEYQMWWLLTASDGSTGWVIDIPGWYAPAGSRG